ncbi:hypothetical protein [Ktedonospora formicarum]|uniref:HAMP domain-containing protein n=1 Tax=Ktedonospora formicarum TaxID=2778364 RepID=A0A8J3MRZ7_9CHLR|nr:hypothetical protein [Ktedonospora formicarum]GHO45535.1 hypothetical protein KSX_36980 [Ktedonospora formicarum]
MDLSLRLDTLGLVEVRYLRGRERHREWPQFELLAASRQARILAYFPHDVAEQLHQQILTVEAAVGLGADDDEEHEHENGEEDHQESTPIHENETKVSEKESSFSPAFAQTLKQLNELARQRLPDGGNTGPQPSGDLSQDIEALGEEDDALEQLQDAFAQMMEVVRELAEELSTDALKLTGRFKCARTNIEFVPRPHASEDDEDDEDEDELEIDANNGVIDIEVELVMVLQLFEEGHARLDDLPAVELQLDVDDFERLHETLDFALERERRGRRRPKA